MQTTPFQNNQKKKKTFTKVKSIKVKLDDTK